MSILPSSWKEISLGDVVGESGLFVDGDWVESKDQDENGDVRLIQLADVGSGEFLDKSSRYLTSTKAAELRCTHLRPGDLLVARMPDPIGRACIFPGTHQPCVTVVDVCIVRPDPYLVDARWLMWVSNSPQFQWQIGRFTTGTTRKRISRSNLQKLLLDLPPLAEQKRIAAILDKADAVRRKRQEAIRLTEEFLRSAFLEMFGDPAINPKKWSVTKINDILDHERDGTRCGPFGSALPKRDYVAQGIPVWGIDNVQPNRFVQEDSYFITEKRYRDLTAYSVQPGDILVSRAGTVGRMCVAWPTQSPSIIGSNLIRVSVDQRVVTPEYIAAIFSYFPKRVGGLRASSDESAYSFMKTNVLRQIKIPLPPMELLRTHTRLLAKLDESQSKQLEARDTHDALFNSLVQRAFRGKL